MKKKNVLLTGIICVATMISLTGCGQPKTAAEVIQKSKPLDNCTYTADGNLTMGVDLGGFALDMPIGIKAEGAMTKEGSHATMDMSLSLFGESTTTTQETYVDYTEVPAKTYVRSLDEGASSDWTVSEEAGSDMANTIQKFDASKFQNAEMVYDKDAKTYTINASLTAIMDEKALKDNFGSATDSLTELGISDSDLLGLMNESTVTLVYDNNLNLSELTVPTVNYSAPYEEEGVEGTINISFDIKVKYADYGKATGTKVPDDVKANAKAE